VSAPKKISPASRGEMPPTGTPAGEPPRPGRQPVDPADLDAYAAEHLPAGWGAGQRWSLEPSVFRDPIAYVVVPMGGVIWNDWKD
jgi:hypothetical protein